MEYYETCLDKKERTFYHGMLDAFRRRSSFVKAENITDEKNFLKCISAVQYDWPELFYVDFSQLQYVAFDDGWEYRPQYLYDQGETNKKQQQIVMIVNRIHNEMGKKGLTSIYQKCGLIHSYLVRNCTYDNEAAKNPKKRKAYTMEGPLLEKTGVCQGIAFAYRFLCRKCGIEAIIVRGVSLQPGSSSYEGHAWNLIRAGDCAAQIDVTWDMCLTLPGWPIRYDYFFLPDIEMMRDHHYVRYPICRKMQTSYFEKSQSQFKELNELDTYVKRELAALPDQGKSGSLFMQFKMANRKETEEAIQKHVSRLLQKSIHRSFSYTFCVNQAQSVFIYKIDIQ